MSDPVTETDKGLLAEALESREDEARQSLRQWLKGNPGYTYQTFLDRCAEPTDKSTVSIWLNGRLSAKTSRKARLLMEAAEELMIAPTGDKTVVDDTYDREPRDDDDRYLMNMVHELRTLSQRLCLRFPVRLVQMAGKYAVPARNLIDRDRTAGTGNVLSYMHDGVEYATTENISQPALRLAIDRSARLKTAGLGALPAYEGKDRDYAEAKFWNYDASLRARAGLTLGDETVVEAAIVDLVVSLDFNTRVLDGIGVNIVEVLDQALRVGGSRATSWSAQVADRGRDGGADARLLRHALRQRKVTHLRCHWAEIAPDLVREGTTS